MNGIEGMCQDAPGKKTSIDLNESDSDTQHQFPERCIDHERSRAVVHLLDPEMVAFAALLSTSMPLRPRCRLLRSNSTPLWLALKERTSQAESSEENFSLHGWDDTAIPTHVRDTAISDLGSETPRSVSRSPSPACTWNPDIGIDDVASEASAEPVVKIDRIRFGISQLDPDMLGYLAECGAITVEVADQRWFSFYIDATASKPLNMAWPSCSKVDTEYALLCISAQAYVTLAELQVLHPDYMPGNNKLLAAVMHARLERSHYEIPSCLSGRSDPEFDKNTFFDCHEHDFSSLRQREVVRAQTG
ncbi:hypothetical protein IWX90DRAFT_417335 [Phyllosticta citrichinensis]|uniref:Uncharacterized protein n=1 Tax=Phyllosticta citrichinensis TaxID=1130410 RepID=A0ABR1XKM0_9PEZI